MAGPLGGAADGSGSIRHRVLKTTLMVGPLGALPVGPAASTTEVSDDVDGWPLEGATGGSDSIHHRVLKITSMAGPLGALPAGPAVSTTKVDDNVDGGPP
jgi:hypothetical protein